MPSSRDKRTSATRHSLPLAATAAANNGPSHRPRLSTSAKAASPPTVSRGHGRTRSFLTGLLDRSNSSGPKRASLQPPAHRPSHSSSTKASPSPTVGEAGLRAPGAQKKRLSAPADFKGKASVSLPLNLSPTVVASSALSRSHSASPYLTSKPLPLGGDEMARLAAWEFVAAADSAQAALDKGKGRARDDDDEGAGEVDAGGGGPASAWDGWHGASTSADLSTTRSVSLPALDSAARFSVGSDRLSTIAFAGPALAPAPLARPPLLAAEATGSRYSIPYHLSPILETDTAPSSDVGCLDAPASSHGPVLAPESTTARPVLHIDPFRRPTRMHSDMSMSVYSRQSFAEPDHDDDDHDAGGGASEWGEELRSYFSPDTPAPRSLSLEGLAIRGATAESMPRPTPTSLLEGEVVFDPLPAPSLPSQIALSARPSFSAFAFPSTSSLATSSSSERASRVASPLFDEAHGPAAVSTVTVATSVFETVDDSEDGRSTHGKELHPSESGGWRTGWGWDMFPRPEPATVRVPPVESGEPCAPTAMGPPVIVNPSSPTSPTLPRHSVAPAPPAAPAPIPATSRAPASSSVRSPVLLPLAARALRKREKSLPSIPDNASMWSGVVAGASIPHEEMHVEVFCTRELVRRTRDGEKRTVMERTLLFTEEA